MMVLSEGFGYILYFKDKIDLENTLEELKTELRMIERDKTKPPFLISFYTDNGVTQEFMETHLIEFKKRFAHGK